VQALRVEQDGHTTVGYDACITASRLSGGQRQRIVLARAILRDPPILILDEATSQVDSESEVKIQEALEDVTRNRTTFIIAHRFSTIARADVTVVLDQGRIVGVGRHEELLAGCPFYANLVRTQFARGLTGAP
jgi:ABC-type multidrug transport system fused ATPase/permease subunit